MSAEIAGYLDEVRVPWQADLCRKLDALVHRAIPDVIGKLQYGKPHYRKNNQYAAVIGTAKAWVTLTIFNAAAIDEAQIEGLLRQAASTL